MQRPASIVRELAAIPVVRRPGAAAHRGATRRLGPLALHLRPAHLIASDALGTGLTAALALLLWTGAAGTPSTIGAAIATVATIVLVRLLVNAQMGIYRRAWRFAGVHDMTLIVACSVVGSALAVVALAGGALLFPALIGGPPGPAFWVMELFGAFVVMAGTRFAIRLASEIPQPTVGGRPSSAPQRTLLYGAGWAGVMIARSSQRDPSGGVLPVGFLDDDRDLAGRDVIGLPVYGGLEMLGRAARESGAEALLITMPRAPGSVVRDIVERARELELDVRTVPSVTDLIDGSLDASRLRSVRVEDLLRRPPTRGHAIGAAEVFEGRTVLITGAAGSIGSELARQVLALGPRRTVLIDRAESALYLVERELDERLRQGRASGARWAEGEVATHLVNVASRSLMQRLFEEERPDVVLHAAAYKHVPMLEDNPSEAVQVNIGGTRSTVDAAEAAGVQRFILVSTDKAVRPSSVMGASKRVAEMIVADAARRTGRPYASVRFGNVLGSNGSVVPIFQDQLQKGEPLTITHPEMTRYFMTIPEAAWLILDAAVLARPSDLFVLDMGQPVRILDIARDLARLAGRDPDSVTIKVVGLRKGEKLHEELFYDEEQVEPTEVPKVLRSAASAPPEDVLAAVRQLILLADGEHDAQLRDVLHAYVRGSLSRDEQDWRQPGAFEIVSEPGPTHESQRLAVPLHERGVEPARPARRGDGRSRDEALVGAGTPGDAAIQPARSP